MIEFDAMQIFVRVAELASFTRAADSLGLPKASISTGVQRLESDLGTRLLHRTTRRVQMTQDGQAFYERCKDLLADMDEVQAMFRAGPQALRGRLRVDMPSGVARRVVLPNLADFLRAHPDLEVELSSTDRRVDLVREGFDCVVRVGSLGDGSLVARPLGAYRIANCASPAYLREFGTPRTLDDLAKHRLIHYVRTLGAKSEGFEYRDGAGYANLPMPGALTVNNADAYEAACLAGLGITQAPTVAMQEHFDTGRLVEILPDHPAQPMPVSIVYAHRRNLSLRVRTFMDWVGEVLGPYLERA